MNNMRCDLCGDDQDTYWLHGTCRCRISSDCIKRNPIPWRRIIAERSEPQELITRFFSNIEDVLNK